MRQQRLHCSGSKAFSHIRPEVLEHLMCSNRARSDVAAADRPCGKARPGKPGCAHVHGTNRGLRRPYKLLRRLQCVLHIRMADVSLESCRFIGTVVLLISLLCQCPHSSRVHVSSHLPLYQPRSKMQFKSFFVAAATVALASAQSNTPTLAAALNSTSQLSSLNTLLGQYPDSE